MVHDVSTVVQLLNEADQKASFLVSNISWVASHQVAVHQLTEASLHSNYICVRLKRIIIR